MNKWLAILVIVGLAAALLPATASAQAANPPVRGLSQWQQQCLCMCNGNCLNGNGMCQGGQGQCLRLRDGSCGGMGMGMGMGCGGMGMGMGRGMGMGMGGGMGMGMGWGRGGPWRQ
jgi:hypothetical protein